MPRRLIAQTALILTIATLPTVAAEGPAPIFKSDFETTCVSGEDWRISDLLAEAIRANRIRCVASPEDAAKRALAVTVAPGDAYDPNPGSEPTERAEIQVKRELVKFNAMTWYTFRFRVESPWVVRKNRTVIHQIKQNIDPRYQKGKGGEEICDPGNPLFKIEVDSDGKTPVFRAKIAGTETCGDSIGQARFCGDWPIQVDHWHRVNVAIKPSQKAGDSHLQLWLDGRACPAHNGVLGYPRYGITRDEKPFIDTQPRFGIYRDALQGVTQTIFFDDIAFWDKRPAGDAAWVGIELGEE